MGEGTSRRDSMAKTHWGVTAAGDQPKGLFMPFYKVGPNMPYAVYFDPQS